MSNLIENYHHTIHSESLREDRALPIKELLIWQDNLKKMTCYYAPFDHVNRQADIIIVGITPGRTQMNRSINALKLAMDSEQDIDTTLKSVKQHASLSGSMRPRIVEMLNRLGYAKLLGIECCNGLWAEHNHRVHFCSLLKYPVFVNGKDYCGQPKLFNTPELEQLLFEEFVHNLSTINPNALIVPLGEMVATVLTTLHQQGHIQQQLTTFQNKVVAPPHPSGANAESIALLLRQDYPTLAHYQDEMYQQYRRKKSWLKRGNGQAQAEESYKKARAGRWQAMSHVRQAYGI
jgi:uracil-DNA glycosylase